jgi:hypothetical protein
MMGYDMNWASFNVVEVMSSPRIHLKSIGYLGATQSFTPDTDVLMLITNLLKKVRPSRSTCLPCINCRFLGHNLCHSSRRCYRSQRHLPRCDIGPIQRSLTRHDFSIKPFKSAYPKASRCGYVQDLHPVSGCNTGRYAADAGEIGRLRSWYANGLSSVVRINIFLE